MIRDRAEGLREQLRGEVRHRVDRLAGRPVLAAPALSIEFDDGYRSAHEHALPLLEARGWRPTQYVVTGTPSVQMGADPAELMDHAAVRDWAGRAEVGSHTVTHTPLDRLDEGGIRRELTESRESLEELLGRPIELFAAPFGSTTATATSVAREVYATQRLVGGLANTPRTYSPWATHGLLVKRSTRDRDLRELLVRARRRRSWLVLVWHRVGQDLDIEWDLPVEQFRRQMDLIAASGIEVVPTAEMARRLLAASARG